MIKEELLNQLLDACKEMLDQFEDAVDPNYKGDVEAFERLKATHDEAREALSHGHE